MTSCLLPERSLIRDQRTLNSLLVLTLSTRSARNPVLNALFRTGNKQDPRLLFTEVPWNVQSVFSFVFLVHLFLISVLITSSLQYYPSNINRSRCCDQAICTECFVQIKRNEPTATHLVSEPAACPFCVQDNFGIVYRPPLWKAGIGSDASVSRLLSVPLRSYFLHCLIPTFFVIIIQAPSWPEPPKESTQPPTHRRRQKSYSADSPEVVTTGIRVMDYTFKHTYS